MASHPDLTLPATAPSVRKYQTQPETLYPIALYTLIPLSPSTLITIQTKCESQCESEEPGENVLLAPQHLFPNQPLRAIFDYYLELGERGEKYNPIYFLVVVDEEWEEKGVLLVTLDDDEMECNVDSFRIKAEESGLIYVNLNIANEDWSEVKEGYEIGGDEGGEEDEHEDEDDDEDDDEEDDGEDE